MQCAACRTQPCSLQPHNLQPATLQAAASQLASSLAASTLATCNLRPGRQQWGFPELLLPLLGAGLGREAAPNCRCPVLPPHPAPDSGPGWAEKRPKISGFPSSSLPKINDFLAGLGRDATQNHPPSVGAQFSGWVGPGNGLNTQGVPKPRKPKPSPQQQTQTLSDSRCAACVFVIEMHEATPALGKKKGWPVVVR